MHSYKLVLEISKDWERKTNKKSNPRWRSEILGKFEGFFIFSNECVLEILTDCPCLYNLFNKAHFFGKAFMISDIETIVGRFNTRNEHLTQSAVDLLFLFLFSLETCGESFEIL